MQADEPDTGMRHNDTLPCVETTMRFLAVCERYGSEESAVAAVVWGRRAGVPGLPYRDDWPAWNAAEMRAEIDYRHGLDRLWRQAEAVAGPVPAVLAEADLQHLTKYGGEFRYPAPGSRQLDPAATWRRLEAPERAVVAHAERTVPGLVERTKARIAEE